jgi:hypothetical protein
MLIDKIMFYENGELSPAECVYLFAELVSTGMVWHLQGSYGRTAERLIDNGILTRGGDIDEARAIECGIDM